MLLSLEDCASECRKNKEGKFLLLKMKPHSSSVTAISSSFDGILFIFAIFKFFYANRCLTHLTLRAFSSYFKISNQGPISASFPSHNIINYRWESCICKLWGWPRWNSNIWNYNVREWKSHENYCKDSTWR